VEIDRYQPRDRADIDAMYRLVFGNKRADASAQRWEWQYLRNPNSREPQIWVARDNGTVVGQYATMPVRLKVGDAEIDASWGMDVMVAPDRQRQGLGEQLFQVWDRHVGASLGMGLSTSSYRLFRKLKWPDMGSVPCLVKPLRPAAFVRHRWPAPINTLVSYAGSLALMALRDREKVDPHVRRVEHFDARFTDLWQRVSPRFDFAVKRDAAYLEWKFVEAPHVHYRIIALDRDDQIHGYAVFRHVDDRRGRVTALVDLLADPEDTRTVETLLRSVESAARDARSNKIRAFATNKAFRRMLYRYGYFRVRSTIQLVAKVNAVPVTPKFYADTSRWHVTFGDSDQDR
jgi:GNAT superfamily N-acetyltransferase